MTVETETKYAGEVDQQHQQTERIMGSNLRAIPKGLEFATIPGVSNKVGERLSRVQPATSGQAARIPTAILDVYL
jgi:tRNA uridine 5-carboxymethylaminomethyl modification enzyme